MNDPCSCCEQPPCSAPTLECDSISQSKSKVPPCGFTNPDDGLVYLVRRTAAITHSAHEEGCYEEGCVVTEYPVEGEASTFVAERTCRCVDRIEIVTNVSEKTETTDPDTCDVTTDGGEESEGEVAFASFANITAPGPQNCDGFPSCVELCSGGGFFGCPVAEVVESGGEVTYEDLAPAETTAALIARTVAALLAYDDDFNDSCSANQDLSEDESSYSLQRTKWRVAHKPTGTCYLKVWLKKVFTPETGSPVTTNLTPYVWTGAGNPCLPDPTSGINETSNKIVSSPTTESEPATDGTTIISIVKWSCLAVYTPPDDGSANGFPV